MTRNDPSPGPLTDPRGEPIAAKTIADQTYHQLRWDIVSGALAPGTKLAMDMLTKRYGVGMSPLREALVRLTGDALVHAEGQRGFWVTHVSIDELEDTMKTRTLIESEALARSIELGDEAWAERVRESYAALSAFEAQLDTGGDQVFAQWEHANRLFHEALVSACGSPWLIRMRRMLHQHSERYRLISLSHITPERDVHDEHEAIKDAALGRKALKATRLIELHLDRTTDAVRMALESRQRELDSAPTKRTSHRR
ncbi:GntR family transcriptional regulator [Sphingoaurantiacus capsulatus]|uniref:GntR family transcriptional regulator n=1 Tax=Sphingoaurantiacus capsulatus TaxID=1771310 RepID=A0ABV7XA16_9SPHN